VLEASYLVFRLPPFFRNFGKRLVKSPKLYFYDAGLAAWLAGVRSADELRHGPMRGALFETWVAGEVMKRINHRLLSVQPYHWRDNAGHEVDVLVERGGCLLPLECKSGATAAADWYAPIERFLDLVGAETGGLIFGGEDRYRRGRVEVFGWRGIEEALDLLLGKEYGL
jgi:hypothetical protein